MDWSLPFPSTNTRARSGYTRMTLPSLPRSSPAITLTRSPFFIFRILYPRKSRDFLGTPFLSKYSKFFQSIPKSGIPKKAKAFYTTSGAKEMMRIIPFSLSSLATGPNTRVPTG